MRVLRKLMGPLHRREFLQASIAAGLALQLRGGAQAASETSGDDWTTFRNGPQLLGVAGGSLPAELELLWEVRTADGVVSTPAISKGLVYVGALEGRLFCLDLKTGKEQWNYRSIESTDPNEFAPGFQAPIAVTDDLIFAGDDQGMFHAISRADGKMRWQFETGSEIVGGPTLLDDKVIFGSHDAKLYCLKQSDGSKVWEFATQGPVNGTPVLSGQYTFITGCDKPVLRVVDTTNGTQVEEAALDQLLIASAAVVDEILYFGTDEGAVLAYDWKQKKALWTYSVPNREQQIHSSPAVQGDVVVIGSRDKHLHAIDRKTGEKKWTFQTRAKIDGSPVIVGDRVFVGSSDKFLYAVSLADGRELWKHSVGQAISGSPAVGEGCLVIGSESSSGRILCFGAKS